MWASLAGAPCPSVHRRHPAGARHVASRVERGDILSVFPGGRVLVIPDGLARYLHHLKILATRPQIIKALVESVRHYRAPFEIQTAIKAYWEPQTGHRHD